MSSYSVFTFLNKSFMHPSDPKSDFLVFNVCNKTATIFTKISPKDVQYFVLRLKDKTSQNNN